MPAALAHGSPVILSLLNYYGMLRRRKYGDGRDGRCGGDRVVVGVNVDRPVRVDGHVSARPVTRDWHYDTTGWPKPFRKPPDCRASP